MTKSQRKISQKKGILTALLTLLFLVGLTVPSLAERIKVQYLFDPPQMEKVKIGDVIYDRIIIPESPNSGLPNQPALPAHGAYILLPPNCQVENIDIIQGEKIQIGKDYFIEPVTTPIRLSDNPGTFIPPLPDEQIYQSSTAFPSTRFQNIGLQSFRGYRYLVLKLQPAEYIPDSGELFYYSSLTVIINTTETDIKSSLYRGLPEDEAEIRSKIDNPDILTTYSSMPKQGAKNFDLLIITTPTLAPFFEMLKDYHDTTGVITEIRTTDVIGSIEPDDIRAYIKNCYLNDGIQYVIIGGDDDIIPALDLYVISWEGDDNYVDWNMPGDIYFSCLDGTYNYDGDELWGEPTDGEGGGDVDLVAEVYLGRASASSVGEAYTFVIKTIEYLSTEDPYLNNTVLVGEQLGFGGLGEYGGYSLDEIINKSDAHGYTTFGHPSDLCNLDLLYELTYPGNDWPQAEIISRINSGVHIVNHYGHCNTNWSLKMTSNDISQFTNYDYCFIYSQGCYCGQFDDVDGWAEKVTVHTDKGAFAVVMNSRYGWGDYDTDGPSQRFDREFFDAIYNPEEAKPQLGRANQDSKEDNLYRIGDGCMRWCYYQLNLFGDPSIAIKNVKGIVFDYPTGVPEMVTAEQTTSFDVMVSGIGSGIPLSGSGQLHYSVNGDEMQVVAMTTKASGLYQATLPALTCGDELEYYVSAEEETYGRFYDPEPETPNHAIVIKEIDTVFADNFGNDNGWTTTGGLWARGIPTGQGGNDQQYPTPDPVIGYNGPKVYGYNLNGNYEYGLSEMNLISPIINCSGKQNVHLKYARWLGVEGPAHDHAYIRISNNGTDWTNIWQNEATIADNTWHEIDLDISLYADNQPVVYLCWTMGTTDGAESYCGWNIDDVKILAYQCLDFVCGDVNGDALVNIFDATFLITHLYRSGPAPDPPESADVNNDGAINIFDITYLISFLYRNGPDPTCP
jgi:hypothetical protein